MSPNIVSLLAFLLLESLSGALKFLKYSKIVEASPLTHTMDSAKFHYPLQFSKQTYGPARLCRNWIKSNSILLILCSRLFVFSIFCAVMRCKAVIPRGGARLPVFFCRIAGKMLQILCKIANCENFRVRRYEFHFDIFFLLNTLYLIMNIINEQQ